KLMFFYADISAVAREVERRVRLIGLAVTIGQLAQEVRGVTSLRPGLSQVHANGARRPANLARERKSLVGRKAFRDLEYSHREIIGALINRQFFSLFHRHDRFSRLLAPGRWPHRPRIPWYSSGIS